MNVTDSSLEVHLPTSASVTRDNVRWPFPLNENNQPTRNMENPLSKVESIHEIIDWLDVEDSERYQKRGGKTYCNIYAYDFCYLCRTYIPRVWWDDDSVNKVMSGQKLKPRYGTNVFELNANSIYDWYENYGSEFGWHNTDDLSHLQESANQGMVCVIVAKRQNRSRSGHITAIVPESVIFQAKREDGKVVVPVESQAGARNYEYVTKQHQWWLKAKFSDFGIWIHE